MMSHKSDGKGPNRSRRNELHDRKVREWNENEAVEEKKKKKREKETRHCFGCLCVEKINACDFVQNEQSQKWTSEVYVQ